MAEKVTVADVIALGDILKTCEQKGRVTYMDEDGETIRHGIARHVVRSPENVGFVGKDMDLRDAYLRVTLKSGFEAFPSIRHLMKMVHEGGFVEGWV